MKILIAGVQYETDTFAPTKVSCSSCVQGESFPPPVRDADVLGLREVNVPIGGFIRAMEENGRELKPVIWAGTSASAHVTTDAFERIGGEILAAIEKGGFDAIYLDLHGAMVTGQHDDADGELLERLRQIVGDRMPVVVSLNLHANVTARMFCLASALVAYRPYPHVDRAETGERAARILEDLMWEQKPLHGAMRRVPFFIPVNGMGTLVEPACETYRLLEDIEERPVVSVSFAPGLPAAGLPECGPTIWAYSFDEDAAERAADALLAKIVGEESR